MTIPSHILRPHSDERGTAIFVVVLVVTLLTGIGLFAARVTGSVDAATGNARQSAQARALALYAAQLAPVALAVEKTPIMSLMDRPKNGVAAPECPTNRFLPNVECAVRQHLDLAMLANRTGAANGLLTAQAASTHGSLGPSTGMTALPGIEGNLRVEYFERTNAPPANGECRGGNCGNVRTPLEFAITASAQIRPIIGAANNDWCSPANTTSNANIQAVRLYVTVP